MVPSALISKTAQLHYDTHFNTKIPLVHWYCTDNSNIVCKTACLIFQSKTGSDCRYGQLVIRICYVNIFSPTNHYILQVGLYATLDSNLLYMLVLKWEIGYTSDFPVPVCDACFIMASANWNQETKHRLNEKISSNLNDMGSLVRQITRGSKSTEVGTSALIFEMCRKFWSHLLRNSFSFFTSGLFGSVLCFILF